MRGRVLSTGSATRMFLAPSATSSTTSVRHLGAIIVFARRSGTTSVLAHAPCIQHDFATFWDLRTPEACPRLLC